MKNYKWLKDTSIPDILPENITKSVINTTTVTVSLNVISIDDSLEEEDFVVIFDEVTVIDLQGKGQFDNFVPSFKSIKLWLLITTEVVTRIMLLVAQSFKRFSYKIFIIFVVTIMGFCWVIFAIFR